MKAMSFSEVLWRALFICTARSFFLYLAVHMTSPRLYSIPATVSLAARHLAQRIHAEGPVAGAGFILANSGNTTAFWSAVTL